MTNDEYTSRLLELLRYVPYLKEDKSKIQRFLKWFSIIFKDTIEFDEPRSLEEAIHMPKHFYEQTKCISHTKQDSKGNNNTKWK